MKKHLFVLAIASLALVASCKSSKKGAWLDKDKSEFTKACEKEISTMKDSEDGKLIQSLGVNLDDFGKKSCDCALKKIEQNYDSPKEADKDSKGIDKIVKECSEDVMEQLKKK
jgi:hypothetical protein